MRYKRVQIGLTRLAASFGIATVVGWQLLPVSLASATGTAINVNVCDQKAGTLQVISPVDGAVVRNADVNISGKVSRLSQLRAYVNGTFHMTIPLDTTSTTFSYTSNLSPGKNIVKLVGIDPCSAVSPEAVMTLTYDVDAPTSPVTQAMNTATDGAVDAGAYMTDQVQQAAQTQPAVGLSSAVYSAMQALDLAPMAGSTEAMHQMTQRFVGVVGGASLVLFAHPMFVGYHLVRYQLMQWNLPAMPALVRRHSLLALRLVGGALFFGAFFI